MNLTAGEALSGRRDRKEERFIEEPPIAFAWGQVHALGVSGKRLEEALSYWPSR